MSRKKKNGNGNGNKIENEQKVEVETKKRYPKARISIEAKSDNQKLLLKSIKENLITIVVGPPGTGKTKLAVVSGLREFVMGKYEKMIFTRPCIEANGENLGFLPGDLNEKIHPYMYPIFDFLSDYLPAKQIEGYVKAKSIMTFPLAFMRGCSQPLTSQVLTPCGFKNMGDIKVGDVIIGGSGDRVVVDGVFPQGEKDVYEIIFSDKSKTECCGGHLWLTETLNEIRYKKGPSVKNTKEIIRTLKSGVNYNHRIPIVENPVDFEERRIPIDPYLLGFLLGDGNFHKDSTIKLTTSDEEIIKYVEKVLPKDMVVKYASGYDYRLIYNRNHGVGNPLKKKLKDLNLIGTKSLTKFIPEIYKVNSVNIRIEVLRGLMDSDGCIYKCQKGRNNRVQFYSVSERMVDDVLFIVESLGGIGFKRVRKSEEMNNSHNINGRIVESKHDLYVLSIKMPPCINPFRLKRKADKYKPEKKKKRLVNRKIKIINYIGKKECQCISVKDDKKLYLTNNFIITHNTFRNSFVLLDEGQNTTPEQIRMFLTRIGENCKVVITGDPLQTDIRNKNGIVDACERLEGVNGLNIVRLTKGDIIRNPIVAEIEERYS